MKFLQDIVTRTRSLIDEINEGESDWDDQTELVPYINDENTFLATQVRNKRQDFFGRTYITPLVASQFDYYLPVDCVFPRFVEILTTGVSGTPPNYVVDEFNAEWREISPAQDGLRSMRYSNRSYYSRLGIPSLSRVGETYALWDDRIVLSPSTDLVGYLRLWFIRHMPGLHYGTLTGAAASTATLAAVPTKGTLEVGVQIYKGMLIGIYSGTGAGQIRRITDYNQTTRVVTVDSAWDVVPTGAVYSIISPIPPTMQELLSLGGALRATAKVEDDQNRFTLMYSGMKKDFLKEIDPRNQQGVRRVNRV